MFNYCIYKRLLLLSYNYVIFLISKSNYCFSMLSLTLKNIVILTLSLFGLISFFLFLKHEIALKNNPHGIEYTNSLNNGIQAIVKGMKLPPPKKSIVLSPSTHKAEIKETTIKNIKDSIQFMQDNKTILNIDIEEPPIEIIDKDNPKNIKNSIIEPTKEQKGLLICNGTAIDSEVIYWKIVPGDDSFESPITPHHGEHHDRYLTFEYDAGGWNNIRMGLECLLVAAHATGRTLVVPPQQHLYLLGANHKDAEDKVAHDEMGFEDFFDMELLRSHRGLHVLHMEEFLAKEALTGGLKGIMPPGNKATAWGRELWKYMKQVADYTPIWQGIYLAFPNIPGDFNMTLSLQQPQVKERLHKFAGTRKPEYYDERLQEAHHIHIPSDPEYRILQHHYAFAFFADVKMQSFYRRFIRDYMRYKDSIQCAGHELLQLVRAEAKLTSPQHNGDFYALHIRRGDFQFKEVKISAEQIVMNLHYPNGTSMIPSGALVYLSTDDPEGLCKNCLVQRKPCTTYTSPKPAGCPEDTSWNAFIKAGWKIRFLTDYLHRGYLKHVNPNTFGMVESIICSKAKLFAGTFFSTFTGYIHRLRGYHGIGESTYYHSTHFVFRAQLNQSLGHGFSREWRAGWTDDGGEQI